MRPRPRLTIGRLMTVVLGCALVLALPRSLGLRPGDFLGLIVLPVPAVLFLAELLTCHR